MLAQDLLEVLDGDPWHVPGRVHVAVPDLLGLEPQRLPLVELLGRVLTAVRLGAQARSKTHLGSVLIWGKKNEFVFKSKYTKSSIKRQNRS